ncbi:lipopolysaccharide biosynthesis protein [Larkinella insperata]|uniref:Lipopolysaccharide biosynthesis protein n=1 Tax=Larkinella insperata TaxID=332158 RepID=A0ABW3Q9X6_9BACT|nr:oligosaccharide flippase family protein [Larkinella insperata]
MTKFLFDKLKKTAWYLGVPAVNFAISTFTFPILTTYLSASDYGLIGYFGSLIQFVNIFYGLSFNTYFMSVYHRYQPAERGVLVRKLVTALLLWNVLFLPLSVGLLGSFLYLNDVDIPLFPIGVLALAIAGASFFRNFLQISYRLDGAAFRFFAFMSGQRVVLTSSILLFVAYGGLGALGHYLGALVAEGIFLVIVMSIYFRGYGLIFDKALTRDALRVTLPLLPASLLYIPCVTYDTIVLAKVGAISELGIYNVGKNIGTYVYTIGYAFYQVFEPIIYRAVGERNVKALVKTVVQLSLVIGLIIIVLNAVMPQVVSYLTNNRFNNAVPYARILLLSSGLTVLFSVGDAILNALQKTKTILWIHASAAVICLVSHTYSATHWGHIGVAWSTVLVFGYIFVLSASVGFYELKRATPTAFKLQTV